MNFLRKIAEALGLLKKSTAVRFLNTDPRPVAVWVIWKISEAGPKILTHWRVIMNPKYPDRLYGGTWEAGGETLDPGDGYVAAAVRGIREETGSEINPNWLLAEAQPQLLTTGKGDDIEVTKPLCSLHMVRGDVPGWSGVAYDVKVPFDWEPDPSKADAETAGYRWWSPQELLNEFNRNPGDFMGFHVGALLIKAQELLDP